MSFKEMYKSFIETLSLAGITLPRWVFVIFLIVIALIGIEIIWNKFIKPKMNMLIKVHNDIESISEIRDDVAKEMQRATTRENELNEKVNGMNDKIDDIMAIVSDIQRKNDANEQARLKDRICQSYSYYHSRGYWNIMEKEALESLIESYEIYNSNSFVHTVVVPEMYTWEIRN